MEEKTYTLEDIEKAWLNGFLSDDAKLRSEYLKSIKNEVSKRLYTRDDINKAVDFGTELAQTAGFEEGHDSWIEDRIDAFIQSLIK